MYKYMSAILENTICAQHNWSTL